MKSRAVLAVLLVMAAAQLIVGCSRRASEATSGAPSDTLANGLPRPLLPKLGSWVQVWRSAIPAFTPDSLTRSGPAPYKFEYAGPTTAHIPEVIRTRALIDVMSPDSTRSLDFDAYLVFVRGPEGELQIGREPESRPVLADIEADTLWQVEFCGTSCFYDGAYWIDAQTFALTGATRSGEQGTEPWCGFLDVYDMRSRQRTRWLARTVDAQGFERYTAASESTFAARLKQPGLANR